MPIIHYWEKSASIPEDGSIDEAKYNNLSDYRSSTREIIRKMENRAINEPIDFENLKPNDTSIKRKLHTLIKSFPNRNDLVVNDLLDSFRAPLKTGSKKPGFMVVLLQLNNTIVIALSKTVQAIVQDGEDRKALPVTLHPQNVLRAGILNIDENIEFKAFAYNKQIIENFANYWGIEPDRISWEAFGNINLKFELENFDYPLILSIDKEQLKETFDKSIITQSGSIKIGNRKGIITESRVLHKTMNFRKFYSFYINERENLSRFCQKFQDLIKSEKDPTLEYYLGSKSKYFEDELKIYEIKSTGNKKIFDKDHMRFNILFCTKKAPGIYLNQKYLWKIYDSIFKNQKLEVWHAGEISSDDSIELGSLSIFNNLTLDSNIQNVLDGLLNNLQDAGSKIKLLLQLVYLSICYNNLKTKHFSFVLELISKEIVLPDLIQEFKKDGLIDEEDDSFDIKSADDFLKRGIVKYELAKMIGDSPKTSRISTIISDQIKTYSKRKKQINCIIYGFSDRKEIQPIYNLKSDQINTIENMINKELEKNKIKLQSKLISIPYEDKGKIICVLVLPNG